MAIVTFSPDDFRQDFPQFANPEMFSDKMLLRAFNAAETLLDNTEASPVPYDPHKNILIRETLLHYLTCHLLTLAGWAANGQSGPMTNVSEGSVSVGFATAQATGKNYYLQTPCGQTFWQMSLPYRMGGRYYAAPQHHPWG